MLKQPNFFIVGAPKCGTSTLAQWLGEHNNIFMCDPKEPHHFNTDSNHRFYPSQSEYDQLFNAVDPSLHQAIGEASVWYLISNTAIPNILSYKPDSKFIVCLRNPIEASLSLHDQKYFSGDESIKDFSKAWAIQEKRKIDQSYVPANCVDVRELLYGESCKFASQLIKIQDLIPQQNLKIVLLDDLKENPQSVYEDVLNFLNIETNNKTNFDVINPAKRRHFVTLTRVQRRVTRLKRALGIRKGTGVGNYLNKINRSTRKRDYVDSHMKNELIEYFSDEIKQLELLLDRNLDHWFRPNI